MLKLLPAIILAYVLPPSASELLPWVALIVIVPFICTALAFPFVFMGVFIYHKVWGLE